MSPQRNHARTGRAPGRHRTALEHHCRLAAETVHPRFAAFGPHEHYSTILTVNSGYE